MNKDIPQMEPWFEDEERKAINDYFVEGGWVTEFKKTRDFENAISNFTGSNYCVVVNNGTISLTLIAMALGIGIGDEVLIPNYTMIATPNSIKMLGAKPIFVDVEQDTLCMDFELAKKAITSKTKAIMFMNANGRYPNSGIEMFENLCRKYNLFLIEDSAQALGSFYPDGRHMGTVGIAGSFSFSAPKVISTGQGGAIISNDETIVNKIRRLKDFGRSNGGNDIHETIGYNFKFTDIQAILGIEQMKKLEWRVERKKEIYLQYKKQLKNLEQVKFFEQDLECTTPWFIDCIVDDRQSLINELIGHSIGTRTMYPPINSQNAYGISGDYPVSNFIGNNGLWLPSSSKLSDKQIDYICEKIKFFYL